MKNQIKGESLAKLVMDVDVEKEFLKTSQYYQRQVPDNNVINFIDEKFPPNLNSLIYLNPNNDATKEITEEEINTLKKFKWKRAGEILRGQYTLYNKIEVEDIHQGSIGNCYFLSAVSAIAEFNERFEKIFVSKKMSENGLYTLRFILQGVPEIVVVDDYFPTIDNRFAGATSGFKEIWVQLLEKAYAKINESYASTIAGLPSEALCTLTEAPVVPYIHRRYLEKKDELWEIIKISDENNYIVCTNTGNNQDAERMGLVQSHAYTIISAFEKQGLRLLKIRNPWGSFEWNGDFCDRSDCWNKFPGLKEEIGYVNKDDGIFFMTFNDFLTYFPCTYICKYQNGFHYNYKKVNQSIKNNFVSLKFNLDKLTNISLCLHQKMQRYYKKVKSNYKTQNAIFILARYNAGQYEFIGSDSNNNDKLYIECKELPKGEYHLFANVNWIYDSECRYVISAYSSVPVELQQVKRSIIPANYLLKTLESFCSKNLSSKSVNENVSYIVSLNDNNLGFYFIYVENNSKNQFLKLNISAEYNSKCAFVNHDNVSDRKVNTTNDTTTDAFYIIIPPKGKKFIIWRLLANPWYCKLKLNNLTFQMVEEEESNLRQYDSLILSSIKDIMNKTLVSLESSYFELAVDDGILLIFENQSFTRSCYFKINFTGLVNVVPSRYSNKFKLSPKEFYYVHLKRINIEKEIDYKLTYSFRQ